MSGVKVRLFWIYTCVLEGTGMVVKLRGECPPMREVLELGRAAGLVYALMWESAFRDERGECGGTTEWSVKGLAGACRLGKASVIDALKGLMDEGFIQVVGVLNTSKGKKRWWRVTHPSLLDGVRYGIKMTGLPSERYNETLEGSKRELDGDLEEGGCEGTAWVFGDG